MTDILSGKVNPSGKLPTSFPIVYDDVPSARFFPGENKPESTEEFQGPISKGFDSEVTYGEGIYVGYRYYCSMDKAVAYPFGFGLSYSHFTYSALQLSDKQFNDAITVTLEVTNSGSVAGREVVQLYVSAPSHELDKPERELRAFTKTSSLQPGDSETLQFELGMRDMASWSVTQGAWFAESGEYKVQAAASCVDVRLEAAFTC